MNIKKLINDAYEYLETHDSYRANIRLLNVMIDKGTEALETLRSYEPESPQISELEKCLNDLEYLRGCAEAAIEMGLRDGDDGRDPDNNWF